MVYQIECSCQVDGEPAIYIGETDRELATRVREHRDSWTGSARSKATSAFSTHRDCTPRFEDTKILDRAAHHQMRLLKSAYVRTVGRREAVLLSPNDVNVNSNSQVCLIYLYITIVVYIFQHRSYIVPTCPSVLCILHCRY